MTRSYDQYCGLALALDRIGGRWSLLIVRELLVGPRRYTDLLRDLPGIASNLLAERLRFLASEGIVRQASLPPPASADVYELTELGRELIPAVVALSRWGMRWLPHRSPEQAFRPHWLALAIPAVILTGRVTDSGHLSCRLDIEGERFVLRLVRGRFHVEPADEGPTDIEMAGDANVFFGLLTGLHAAHDAERAGLVSVRGSSRDRAAFWRAVRQARDEHLVIEEP